MKILELKNPTIEIKNLINIFNNTPFLSSAPKAHMAPCAVDPIPLVWNNPQSS